MDIKAEKLNLVRAILDIEDVDLINEIKDLIESKAHDWFDDLTQDQQQSVMRALEQLDRGEFISHEDACKRLRL